jgi:hypothetical protein
VSAAACAGHPPQLWDSKIEGETVKLRRKRQAYALVICASCPIRQECAASVDPKHDEGIRGGKVLPVISDKDRRSAYPQGLIDDLLAITPKVCPECGRAMSNSNEARHRKRFHPGAEVAS